MAMGGAGMYQCDFMRVIALGAFAVLCLVCHGSRGTRVSSGFQLWSLAVAKVKEGIRRGQTEDAN